MQCEPLVDKTCRAANVDKRAQTLLTVEDLQGGKLEVVHVMMVEPEAISIMRRRYAQRVLENPARSHEIIREREVVMSLPSARAAS